MLVSLLSVLKQNSVKNHSWSLCLKYCCNAPRDLEHVVPVVFCSVQKFLSLGGSAISLMEAWRDTSDEEEAWVRYAVGRCH